MIKEVADVFQIPGEPTKRWFQGEDVDLILWQDSDSQIMELQLYFDKEDSERVLLWNRVKVYMVGKVDFGESGVLDFKQSPILTLSSKSEIFDPTDYFDPNNLDRGLCKQVSEVFDGFQK